jgi:hypothetical protein
MKIPSNSLTTSISLTEVSSTKEELNVKKATTIILAAIGSLGLAYFLKNNYFDRTVKQNNTERILSCFDETITPVKIFKCNEFENLNINPHVLPLNNQIKFLNLIQEIKNQIHYNEFDKVIPNIFLIRDFDKHQVFLELVDRQLSDKIKPVHEVAKLNHYENLIQDRPFLYDTKEMSDTEKEDLIKNLKDLKANYPSISKKEYPHLSSLISSLSI